MVEAESRIGCLRPILAKNWRDYGVAVGKPSWQSSGILNNANQRSLPVWHCIKKYVQLNVQKLIQC